MTLTDLGGLPAVVALEMLDLALTRLLVLAGPQAALGAFGSLTDGSLGRVVPHTRNHLANPTTGILYVTLSAGDQMDGTVADGLWRISPAGSWTAAA